MTFQELGQSIRERREAAGLSFDDVSARIKISTRILKSIEEGSMVGLPHAVYTKSFVRAFAQQVGFPPEELHTALEEVFPPESLDETRDEPTFKNHAAMQYPGAGKRFAALVVILLILGGLAGGGWYVAVTYGDQILELVKRPFSAMSGPTESEPAQQGGSAAPATSSRVLSQTLQALSGTNGQPSQNESFSMPGRGAPPESAAPASGTLSSSASHAPASAGVAASGDGVVAESNDLRTAEPAAQAPDRSSGASQDASVPSPEGAAPEDAAAGAAARLLGAAGAANAGASNRLVIRADDACWVGSRADGAKGRDFTLHRGENLTLTYGANLELTLGNAGGVTLELNGKQLGRAGQKGRKAVLRFPGAGQ